MSDHQPVIRAVAETATGFALMGTPWWIQFLADVSAVGQAVAAVCGAIVGIVGVVKLFRRWRLNNDTVL